MQGENMPKLSIHCAISEDRTGYNFKELHKWIDSPAIELGYDHRTVNHSYNAADEKKIIEYWNRKRGPGWGEKAVVEWLFHIAIDNLSTAFKKSFKVYGKRTYNYFEFGLSSSNYIYQVFGSLKEWELEEHFEGGLDDEPF
jgi:hypothetical protein